MRLLIGTVLSITIACGSGAAPEPEAAADSLADAGVFSRDNLVAWCIVPFDASKRGPAERAAMLERLGLRALAYDYRKEHIPTFDAEIAALQQRGIRLTAWWCGGVDLQEPLAGSVGLALQVLRRNQTSTDLWVSMREEALKDRSHEEKVVQTAVAIQKIAEAAITIRGRVGLYNHGGWFGEPQNQLEVLKQVAAENVGLVYNFHHGHEHLDRLQNLFPQMLPHLLCVNLNGMTPGGEKILPLGAGVWDQEMLALIRQSGYRGPIGILDHRSQLDAEESLQENLDGLSKLVAAGS